MVLNKAASLNNSTRSSTSGNAATTACSTECSSGLNGPGIYDKWCCLRKGVFISTLIWTKLEITATITAETVVLMVDARANTTSTKTITNTEVDLNEYVPVTDLNSAGTRTTAVPATAGDTVNNHIV